jgi:DNA polymerase alpha subunit B
LCDPRFWTRRFLLQAHEGRINETTVLLEGSRHTCGGQRIAVDLSYLKANKIGYSLFPGQVVAVEGMNPTGRKLVAHRICEGAPPDPPRSSVSDLWRYHHEDAYQGSNPLRIVAACGPFTTSDNLDYQPLLDLVGAVQHQVVPDVVVLAGPFVDLKHEVLASGHAPLAFEGGGGGSGEGGGSGGAASEEFGATYELFFANKIAALLEEMYASEPDLPTQFVLVPSLDDAVAEWVYPQPPLSDRVPAGTTCAIPGGEGLELGSLGLHHVEKAGGGNGARNRHRRDEDRSKTAASSFRRVHCVPNPCTFSVNEVVIGVTSTDSVLHLSTSETSANLELGSRLNRICQHLVQQQSYYPLFPAMVHRANLDLKRMAGWSMPCQPDVLLVPSSLTPFAHRVLGHTVAVNPGRLAQGRAGGTYALAEVHPVGRDALEKGGKGGGGEMLHGVPDRARIEVRRI